MKKSLIERKDFILTAPDPLKLAFTPLKPVLLLNPTRCVSCTERDRQRQRRDRACIYVDGSGHSCVRGRAQDPRRS